MHHLSVLHDRSQTLADWRKKAIVELLYALPSSTPPFVELFQNECILAFTLLKVELNK